MITIDSFPSLQAAAELSENSEESLREILQVYDLIHGREYSRFYQMSDARLQELSLANADHALWTAMAQHSLVGVALAQIDLEYNSLFIQGITVPRNEQGKGIGTELLSHIEIDAAKQGLGRVALRAVPQKIEFYQYRGYVAITDDFQPVMEKEVTHLNTLQTQPAVL